MTSESIETLSLKDLDQDSVTAWSRALGDPDWFLRRRLEALAALDKLERPTGREEAWRFTDPRRAGLDRNRILRAGPEDPVAVQAGPLGVGEPPGLLAVVGPVQLAQGGQRLQAPAKEPVGVAQGLGPGGHALLVEVLEGQCLDAVLGHRL